MTKHDPAADIAYWRGYFRVVEAPIMSKESEQNLRYYVKHAMPPQEALSQISGGRLKGKTDINPQWRYEALTEMFGPVGTGWRYEIRDIRTYEAGDEIALCVTVALYYYLGSADGWSEPVIGTGGSMLVAHERGGVYLSDEAEKMAVTDALSVCCKLLGIASDIYRGFADTKYSQPRSTPSGGAPSGDGGGSRGGGKGKCPDCGAEAVIANRYDGGYVCWKKAKPKPGCGKKWQHDPSGKDPKKAAAVSKILDTVKPMLHEGEQPQERLKEISHMYEIPLGATLYETSDDNLERLHTAVRDELEAQT